MDLLELLKEREVRFSMMEHTLFIYEDADISLNTKMKILIVYDDDVYLNNRELKEFPNYYIIFFGNVCLSHTQIKEFPSYPITFYGSLDMSHTQIKEFPKCSRIFNGSLDISHTLVKELPDCVIINGDLDINDTLITKIPKDLIADRICTPVKGMFIIYIQKDGKIEIDGNEKSIKEWEEFFKERRSFDDIHKVLSEDYVVIEQDFKNAVKLLESWKS